MMIKLYVQNARPQQQPARVVRYGHRPYLTRKSLASCIHRMTHISAKLHRLTPTTRTYTCALTTQPLLQCTRARRERKKVQKTFHFGCLAAYATATRQSRCQQGMPSRRVENQVIERILRVEGQCRCGWKVKIAHFLTFHNTYCMFHIALRVCRSKTDFESILILIEGQDTEILIINKGIAHAVINFAIYSVNNQSYNNFSQVMLESIIN